MKQLKKQVEKVTYDENGRIKKVTELITLSEDDVLNIINTKLKNIKNEFGEELLLKGVFKFFKLKK